MFYCRCLWILLPVFLLTTFTGCWTSKKNSVEDEPFVLGDLLEPFDPPSLEELEKNVAWIDRPVLDSMDLLRQRQANEEILSSLEEALRLKNNSAQDNGKILSALGRLPDDDSKVNFDSSITRHIGGDLKSSNPLFISSTAEFEIVDLISFGLFGFDWNFNFFASKDSVVSWQSSKDGLYDKVVMRNDLTWSDGKPITAHDLEFSFKVVMSKQVPVTSRTAEERLKAVKAYDDHTLVIFHKEALATNDWNLSISVLPKHIYEKSIYKDPMLRESKYHVKYEEDPVVGGPYVITKRVRGQEVVLKRRESYYMHNGKNVRDKPYFKEIRFQVLPDSNTAMLALKSGDIDEMSLTPEQWKTQTNDDEFYKNNTKATGIEWTSFHFCWNTKRPYFQDVRVRKAMSYAFDHKELLEKLRYNLNEPCTGIFHFTSRWAPENPPIPYQYNIEKAEQLLDEAGWIDHDGDGIRDKKIDGRTVKFEFNIIFNNRPERKRICNLLKQNLDEIGIICHVKPMEFTVLQQNTKDHTFDATFGGWGTGADPYSLANIFKTGEIRNFGEYSNSKVDELFEKGIKELNPEERIKIYQQIHLLLWEDQPYTWLYFRSSFYGFNKNLRGYVFSPRGPYTYGPGFSSIWKPAMK